MAKNTQTEPKDSEEKSQTEKLKKMKIRVNEFGEIIREYDVDEINQFLNENVPDKKLSERDEE